MFSRKGVDNVIVVTAKFESLPGKREIGRASCRERV
jgi:hypothetical protein